MRPPTRRALHFTEMTAIHPIQSALRQRHPSASTKMSALHALDRILMQLCVVCKEVHPSQGGRMACICGTVVGRFPGRSPTEHVQPQVLSFKAIMYGMLTMAFYCIDILPLSTNRPSRSCSDMPVIRQDLAEAATYIRFG